MPDLPTDLTTAVEGSIETPDESEAARRAQAAAALVSDGVQVTLADELILVVDDLQVLDDHPAAWRFIEGLVRLAPAELHFLVLSRTEPSFAIERLRGQGQVADIGGSTLAFSPEEIGEVLAALVGEEGDPDQLAVAADRIHSGTAGWPAAVRLAVEAWFTARPDARDATLERLHHPDGPLFAYLTEEVVSATPPETQQLIRRIVHFDRFTADLCRAIGIPDAKRILADLSRRALFLQTHPEGGGWYTSHSLIREYTLARLPLAAWQVEDLHRRAAAWFEDEKLLEPAMTAWTASGDHIGLGRFLSAHGLGLVLSGSARRVIAAADGLPAEFRDAAIERACGEGHLASGNWREAAACFDRAQGQTGLLDAATGWRMGMVHALRGAYGRAIEIYERAERGHSTQRGRGAPRRLHRLDALPPRQRRGQPSGRTAVARARPGIGQRPSRGGGQDGNGHEPRARWRHRRSRRRVHGRAGRRRAGRRRPPGGPDPGGTGCSRDRRRPVPGGGHHARRRGPPRRGSRLRLLPCSGTDPPGPRPSRAPAISRRPSRTSSRRA